MSWPFWILAALAWLAVWVGIVSRCAAGNEGDSLVAAFGVLLPVFSAATCLAAFLNVPHREPVFHQLTLWAHHASILLLFLFLTAGEYFQAEAWWRIRRRCTIASVAASYRRLWVLTETTPAAIALAVFLTGLRLIWDSPQTNSPTQLWLLVLVLGFSIFFWDGIFGYQPIVRAMWSTWKHAAQAERPVSDAAPTAHRRFDSLQLFLHFLAWPFLFMFGLFRWNSPTLLTWPAYYVTEQFRTLPIGWPEVLTVLLIWLAVGLAVCSLRVAFRSLRFFDR